MIRVAGTASVEVLRWVVAGFQEIAKEANVSGAGYKGENNRR